MRSPEPGAHRDAPRSPETHLAPSVPSCHPATPGRTEALVPRRGLGSSSLRRQPSGSWRPWPGALLNAASSDALQRAAVLGPGGLRPPAFTWWLAWSLPPPPSCSAPGRRGRWRTTCRPAVKSSLLPFGPTVRLEAPRRAGGPVPPLALRASLPIAPCTSPG